MPGVWPIVAIAVVVAVVFCPLIMPTGESAGSNNTALEFTQNQPKMKAKKITNKTTIGNATQKRSIRRQTRSSRKSMLTATDISRSMNSERPMKRGCWN